MQTILELKKELKEKGFDTIQFYELKKTKQFKLRYYKGIVIHELIFVKTQNQDEYKCVDTYIGYNHADTTEIEKYLHKTFKYKKEKRNNV